MINNKTSAKTIIFFIFISLYLIGLLIFRDFGLSIDDEYYRKNGVFYKDYIIKFLYHLFNLELNHLQIIYEEIENNPLKNHPAIFETALAFLADIFKLKNINSIYNLSHFLNFTIYVSALFLLFKIINKRFNNFNISIICVLLIFFTPRFFAESFYNSRDIFFFSIFILFLFSIQKLIYKINYKSLLLISFSSALLINAKILGIIPFLIFLLLYLIFISEKKGFKFRDFKILVIISFLTFFFVILLWPYLWIDPFKNFISAYTEIIKVHNKLNVITFFNGQYLSSNNTPWYYRIVWFYITTPVVICILFSISFLNNIKKFTLKIFNLNEKKPILFSNKDEFYDYYLLITFFAVIFLTSKFNNSQFNGWRHLYFIYFIVIYFAADLINNIMNLKKKSLVTFIYFCIFTNIILNINWIIKNHPYQNNSFNIIFSKYAMKNFDLDYWGLTNLHSLKIILENQPNKIIKVATVSFANLETSLLKLKKEDRERIKIIYNLKKADYLINSYMMKPRKNFDIPLDEYQIINDLKVNSSSINTIYKKLE